MSDTVKALREFEMGGADFGNRAPGEILKTAADEIERLRSALGHGYTNASEDGADTSTLSTQEIRIVFDGFPGHESGRFVEVENEQGQSINVGEWHNRGNGLWELRIQAVI